MPARHSAPAPTRLEPSQLRKPQQQAELLLLELLTKGRGMADQAEFKGEEWADEVGTVLERLFTGAESTEFGNSIHRADEDSARAWHRERMRYLESLQNRLRHYDLAPEARGVVPTDRPGGAPTTRKVFVVHGHDEAAKLALARTLEHLDLEPIILHEQPDEGRVLLEKFEAHADVGFAVVLLTPDDECGDERRARQNVILELGYFFGRLGRKRVRALYKEGVKRPSDVDGWVYIPMDDGGAWRLLLARELRAAGFDVDLNRLA